ncbi:MAG: aldehyde dehydrogenase [Rhodospirillales bacterium]|nr:aldehyde dehydrogenase [Rhodospirillales bacterium]
MTVLDDFKRLNGNIFLGGQSRRSTSAEALDVIDPATEDKLGEIAETTTAEIDEAVATAQAAQKKWWAMSGLARSEIMHEVANNMHHMRPRLAEAMTREMGKPFKESMDEVEWSISAIRYNAEIGRSDTGRVMGNEIQGHLNYTLKEPLGVVVSIQTFNYPMVLLAWQSGAALAAGNAVICKPSEYASFTSLLFAEAYAPLPDGLFQVVTGVGPAGKHLVEHPNTHAIAFTGSVPTGVAISETCGRLMKRALIETSGNDPFVVMPSADLDITARAASFSAFMNCGQICVSAERFYVHEDIHDEFLAKLIENAKGIRVGNGLGKVDMGPMVSEKERTRYEAVLENAIKQGANVMLGGGRPAEFNQGWFVEPTILSGCHQEMDMFNNESFGPVAPICKVKSFEEGIELANDSKYGLGANIYTRDLREALRAAEQFEAGMVWVNAPLLDNDAGPFGGTKMSGTGRQLGPEGLETFRKTKFVMIDPDCTDTQDGWWFPYKDEESFPG